MAGLEPRWRSVLFSSSSRQAEVHWNWNFCKRESWEELTPLGLLVEEVVEEGLGEVLREVLAGVVAVGPLLLWELALDSPRMEWLTLGFPWVWLWE